VRPDEELLRESLELVLERDGEFPLRFYQILFERHPETRPLFRLNSLGAQRKMLAQMLMAVVDHYSDTVWLETTLGPLGSQHTGYGVTPEMYPWVASSLVAAIAERCGEQWTADYQRAWENGCLMISGHMIRG
jgi:hemoglobin-like flavoprotein